MKLKKRLLSVVISLVTIVNTTSCSLQNNNREEVLDESSIQAIDDEGLADSNLHSDSLSFDDTVKVTSIPSLMTEDEQIELTLYETLYDETINYQEVIQKYLTTDFDEREDIKDTYIKAIYMYLLSTGTPIAEYIPCLKNLAIMQTNPSCISDELWYELFGKLLEVSDCFPSFYDAYVDLAIYVHEINCSLDHTTNEMGAYTCPSLEEEYNEGRIYKPAM